MVFLSYSDDEYLPTNSLSCGRLQGHRDIKRCFVLGVTAPALGVLDRVAACAALGLPGLCSRYLSSVRNKVYGSIWPLKRRDLRMKGGSAYVKDAFPEPGLPLSLKE